MDSDLVWVEEPRVILAVGCDVCDLERIGRLRERHGERFLRRFLSSAERDALAVLVDPVARLAGRWAAKEAVMKALGTGWGGGVNFVDIEVVNRSGGAPEVRLSGGAAARAEALGVRRWHLSIAHEKSVAMAVVIAEG